MIKTSIILTVYDRPHQAVRMLRTLQGAISEEFEVILVNDHETQNTELKDFCDTLGFVKYIHTGAQKGGKQMWRVPGFALNIGFKHSIGNNIIIGNSEMILPKPEVIGEIVSHVEKGFQCSPPVWCISSRQWLKSIYPFFLGFPRQAFEDIRGYDEDFIGYCFDDDDVAHRLATLVDFIELSEEWKIHHEMDKGKTKGQDAFITSQMWVYNKSMFEARKQHPIRNVGRDWGVLEKEYVRNKLDDVAL